MIVPLRILLNAYLERAWMQNFAPTEDIRWVWMFIVDRIKRGNTSPPPPPLSNFVGVRRQVIVQ